MTCPRPGDDGCTDQTLCPLCPHNQRPTWGWIVQGVGVALLVGLMAAALVILPWLVVQAVW